MEMTTVLLEKWNVSGFGFHRLLLGSVASEIEIRKTLLDNESRREREQRYTRCMIAMKFDFPRTAYVDMDEIEGILRSQQCTMKVS